MGVIASLLFKCITGVNMDKGRGGVPGGVFEAMTEHHELMPSYRMTAHPCAMNP